MPAFNELPIIRVVHPAYHALPNGGHGSFAESANLRFNCVLVFATTGTRHELAETLSQLQQYLAEPP